MSAPLVYLGFAVAVIAFYFAFIRVKTDPRVRELADKAYECAGKISGLGHGWNTPPVRLKPGPWMHRGVLINGNYKWLKIWKYVLWDRILVTSEPDKIWPVLVHEMTHAVRRRNDLPSSEPIAGAAAAVAVEKCGSADVDALVDRFR